MEGRNLEAPKEHSNFDDKFCGGFTQCTENQFQDDLRTPGPAPGQAQTSPL